MLPSATSEDALLRVVDLQVCKHELEACMVMEIVGLNRAPDTVLSWCMWRRREAATCKIQKAQMSASSHEQVSKVSDIARQFRTRTQAKSKTAW